VLRPQPAAKWQPEPTAVQICCDYVQLGRDKTSCLSARQVGAEKERLIRAPTLPELAQIRVRTRWNCNLLHQAQSLVVRREENRSRPRGRMPQNPTSTACVRQETQGRRGKSQFCDGGHFASAEGGLISIDEGTAWLNWGRVVWSERQPWGLPHVCQMPLLSTSNHPSVRSIPTSAPISRSTRPLSVRQRGVSAGGGRTSDSDNQTSTMTNLLSPFARDRATRCIRINSALLLHTNVILERCLMFARHNVGGVGVDTGRRIASPREKFILVNP
jgi:hypothetical protein